MRHREEGIDWIAADESLKDMLDLARRRFGLDKGEPVRVVCAGSHEWLWAQEHSGQGPLLASHGAQQYLAEMRRRRLYAVRLFEALSAQPGVELWWVTEAFPHLKPHDRSYLHTDVAAIARKALEDETPLAERVPTIPRLFTRVRPDDPWQPFPGSNGRLPYTTTSRLIDQYRGSTERRQGHQCVLTKLLPRHEQWLNRCDCPIVTLEQRVQAAEAGISAILLDQRFGVIEPDYDRRRAEVASVFGI